MVLRNLQAGRCQRSALLVVDVQQGLFDKSTPIYHAEQLLDHINTLIEDAHRAEAPVVYTQHHNHKQLVLGSDDWQLHPRLHQSDAYCVIDKEHGDAFKDTSLDEALHAAGVRRVVVVGLMTHGCVRATCLGAKARGYRVVLAADGHSNTSKQAAELIEVWNQKLSAEGAELLQASEIGFD
jgi:nicotinamidase-related amidase